MRGQYQQVVFTVYGSTLVLFVAVFDATDCDL